MARARAGNSLTGHRSASSSTSVTRARNGTIRGPTSDTSDEDDNSTPWRDCENASLLISVRNHPPADGEDASNKPPLIGAAAFSDLDHNDQPSRCSGHRNYYRQLNSTIQAGTKIFVYFWFRIPPNCQLKHVFASFRYEGPYLRGPHQRENTSARPFRTGMDEDSAYHPGPL